MSRAVCHRPGTLTFVRRRSGTDMVERDFQALAEGQWTSRRLLCVGLDSDATLVDGLVGKHRARFGDLGPQAYFNRAIVDATCHVAAAYKPNSAFYEARGTSGISDLWGTIRYINDVAPAVPVILDAKRADIGNTNNGYAEYAFDYLGVDALTVHPYLGQEAMRPFLNRAHKGIFVLCRTSNPGSGEFQDQLCSDSSGPIPLYQCVARSVVTSWNENGNCGLVVGATYPDELAAVRQIVGTLPILVPGIGTQGGDLRASIHAGVTPHGGLFLNAARSIIFSSAGDDYAKAARTEAERLDESIRSAWESTHDNEH